MSETIASFYVTGGTLRPDAPSYVERQADRDLYEGLVQGEFCYVLTSRQMGKSSLMARTGARLRQEGVAVVVLDLTRIGQNLSPEQWYDGLLSHLGEALDLEEELEQYWQEHARWSPLQRWMEALRDVVLAGCPRRIVIFIDEIDAAQSLPFSTDEFFAAIRECYNRRAEDPDFGRLTFCLLGVATPSDLIRDTRTTPFNIGRRIELTDFSEAEAAPLAAGLHYPSPCPLPETERGSALGRTDNSILSPKVTTPSPFRGGGRGRGNADHLLQRILYWTGGHPYLTQRLCQAVARGATVTDASGVDQLCDDLFLSPKARERDDNLLFVRERLLRSDADLASLLDLYAQVRRGKRIPPADTNPLVSLLELSGVTRVEAGSLRVRNRIYAWVFDPEWIRTHMPDAELRRQRAAYHRGLVRATMVAGVIFALMAGLVGIAVQQQRVAQGRLVRMDVAHGMRLVEEGDLFEALPWFAEALRLEEGDRSREPMHRLRLAATLRQCPQLAQVWFHSGPVTSVEFSPDGRWALTASRDGTARVWDPVTGRPVTAPMRHRGAIWSAAFSPDGRRVVTASDDRTARVWDAATAAPITPPLRHRDRVNIARFSPDGQQVVTASADGTAQVWDAATARALIPPLKHVTTYPEVKDASFSPDGHHIVTVADDQARVWNTPTGAPVTQIRQPGIWLNCAEFSPDGRRLVTGSWPPGGARVWEVETGRPRTPILPHDWAVLSARFSPDGRRVLTASGDNTARLWDANTGVPVSAPLKHSGVVWDASFSPDGARLVTASSDQMARVWDAATGELVAPPLRHAGTVEKARLHRDGHLLVTASKDQMARVWDLATRATTLGPLQHHGPLSYAAYSSDGRWIVTASDDHTARVWDALSGRPVTPPLRHRQNIEHAAFSPDGHRVVTASDDGTARVWDARTGAPVTPPLPHRPPVLYAEFSPDGHRVVAASGDQTARVWDATTGRPVTPPMKHTRWVNYASFSPDGRRIVTGSQDGTARVWDAVTGKPLLPPLKHGHDVTLEGTSFSPDGRRILTACTDGSAEIWNADTGRRLVPVMKHSDLNYAWFSPDGRRVVTCGDDSTAQVWDATTGQPLTPRLKHNGNVDDARFSPDGRLVVTASRDGTARVWDAATGEAVTPPLKHRARVPHAEFSPDGRRVLTASWDGTARLWDLASDGRPLADLLLLAQLPSGYRIDDRIGSVPLEPLAFQKSWQALRAKYPRDIGAASR